MNCQDMCSVFFSLVSAVYSHNTWEFSVLFHLLQCSSEDFMLTFVFEGFFSSKCQVLLLLAYRVTECLCVRCQRSAVPPVCWPGRPGHALDISALLRAMASSRSSCSCCRSLFSRSRSARSLSLLAHSSC